MTDKVLAVHEVTGLITEVLPSEIDAIPALKLATKKQIEAAQTKREIEVYGEPIKNGVIPTGPAALEKEDNKVITEDGADNG